MSKNTKMHKHFNLSSVYSESKLFKTAILSSIFLMLEEGADNQGHTVRGIWGEGESLTKQIQAQIKG